MILSYRRYFPKTNPFLGIIITVIDQNRRKHHERQIYKLKLQLDSLAVFSQIKKDPVIRKLRRLLKALCANDTEAAVAAWGSFAAALLPHTASLTEYVKSRVMEDDNFYVKEKASGRPTDREADEAARREIDILQNVCAFSSQDAADAIDYDGYLPSWRTEASDLHRDFAEKLESIGRTGYGIYARYSFFRVDQGSIVPVAHPDFQPLESLFGYERERSLIIKNTRALIDGTGASNMLLYGDAGQEKAPL